MKWQLPQDCMFLNVTVMNWYLHWKEWKNGYRCRKIILFSDQIPPVGMHLPLLHEACWIWMYRHVPDVICRKTNLLHTDHRTSANRERGFPWLAQMKECNHLKTHKTSSSPSGALWGDGPVQARLLFILRVCLCIDLAHVHGIWPSWEICSKLDFKQTWVCLMRCWSGVQVCGYKTGRQNSLPAWPILTCGIILLRSQFSVEMSSSGPLWCGKWEC